MTFSQNPSFHRHNVLQQLHRLARLSDCLVCYCERMLRHQLRRVLFRQYPLLRGIWERMREVARI